MESAIQFMPAGIRFLCANLLNFVLLLRRLKSSIRYESMKIHYDSCMMEVKFKLEVDGDTSSSNVPYLEYKRKSGKLFCNKYFSMSIMVSSKFWSLFYT